MPLLHVNQKLMKVIMSSTWQQIDNHRVGRDDCLKLQYHPDWGSDLYHQETNIEILENKAKTDNNFLPISYLHTPQILRIGFHNKILE